MGRLTRETRVRLNRAAVSAAQDRVLSEGAEEGNPGTQRNEIPGRPGEVPEEALLGAECSSGQLPT